jgi:protein gp37
MNDHLPPFWDEIKDRCWIGVSCGYQEAADVMIPELLMTPARVRFLSCEPLLGPINLTGFNSPLWGRLPNHSFIHWVIVGGESGHNARPMHPDWARDLRDQCQAAGIACLFKQWGEWLPIDQVDQANGHQFCRVDPDGKWFTSDSYSGQKMIYSATLRDKNWHLMAKVGKKAAGRLLDGQEWSEFPK